MSLSQSAVAFLNSDKRLLAAIAECDRVLAGDYRPPRPVAVRRCHLARATRRHLELALTAQRAFL